MRDQIAQIVASEAHGGDPYDIADAIIAALPDLVEAKPLQWVETREGYISKSGYEIKADHSSRNRYYVVCPLNKSVVSAQAAINAPNPLTGGEAKAAAEAHHQAAFRAVMQGVE